MAKKDRTAIWVSLITFAVIGTATFLVIRSLRKKYTLKEVSKFIENPEKLGSPDQKDSWEKVSPELLSTLEKISKKLGKKLKINSGYRSQAHNTKVGGVPNSAHKTGHAVDIGIGSYQEGLRIGLLAKKEGLTRMGIARSFIHIDNSPTLASARWTYSGSGYSKSKWNKDLGFA